VVPLKPRALMPTAGIHLRELQIGGEAEGLGKARRAGAPNVLLRDHLDRGGGLRQSLGRFETEVTCRSINCSILSFFNAAADTLESGRWRAESACWATPGRTTQIRPNVKTSDVAAAAVFMSPSVGTPRSIAGRGRLE